MLKFLASTYVLLSTSLSAIFGLFAMAVQLSEEEQENTLSYKVISPEIVQETVIDTFIGIPFYIEGHSLSRIWDFSAGQVCTTDADWSLAIFVPMGSKSSDCDPMSDFNEEKVVEARSHLPAPQ